MHRYTKLLLASLTATALLAMAVSTASATHLRVSNQNIRATWTSLRFTNSINSVTVLCEVTLEGSFHNSSITKTLGTLVGYVTRASLRGCTGGNATVHTETLPWHIQYNGFGGTLPNISSVHLLLLGVSFEIEAERNICSATTEAEHPAKGDVNLTGGVAENLTPETGASIPLTNGRGGLFCGFASGRFSGPSDTLTVLGSSTRITVTLI